MVCEFMIMIIFMAPLYSVDAYIGPSLLITLNYVVDGYYPEYQRILSNDAH